MSYIIIMQRNESCKRFAVLPLHVLPCLDTHAHACMRDEATVRGEFLDEIIFFPRDAIRLSSLMRPIPSPFLHRVSRFSDQPINETRMQVCEREYLEVRNR